MKKPQPPGDMNQALMVEQEDDDEIKSGEKQFKCCTCESSNIRLLIVTELPEKFILKTLCLNSRCGIINNFNLSKRNGTKEDQARPSYLD